MKAFILSAGQREVLGELFDTKVSSSVTLLQNQVATLLLLGFKSSDVYLVIDSSNQDSHTENISEVSRELQIKLIKLNDIKNRSFASVLSLYSLGHFDQNLLLLNGDTFFDTNDIECLINSKDEPKILVETRYNRNIPGLQIRTNDTVKFLNGIEVKSKVVPWSCYSGAVYLPLKNININKVLNEDSLFLSLSYIEYFCNELKIDFQIIHRKSHNTMRQDKLQSSDLIGGSFAGLHEENIVRKYASGEGHEKLAQEIKWLKNLNSDNKKHFTEIIDYEIKENSCWYTMPRYNYAAMRKLLITGILSPSDCIDKLDIILKFLFKNIYSIPTRKTPKHWLEKVHFDRVFSRFESIKNNKNLNDILSAETIFIDDCEYKNLMVLIKEVQNQTKVLDMYSPVELRNIHGDFHLQNILVDINSNDFILVDPRGDIEGSDIFYDIGKLWHSVNGLYDFIHTDIATFEMSSIDNKMHFKVNYGPENLLEKYCDLRIKIYHLLKDYFNDLDSKWYLKMLFNEAMHFSSLLTFHLKNDECEERAILLYLTSLRLNTVLIEEMEKNT